MKICLVSSNLHPVPAPSYGAIEGQMIAHAHGLTALGHEVHVITVAGPDGGLDDAGDACGIHFHRLGRAYEGASKPGLSKLVKSQLQFARAARSRCRDLRPDVVHWHARYACWLGISEAARHGAALVYHAHNWKAAERMGYAPLSVRRSAARVGAGIDRRIATRLASAAGGGVRAGHLIAVSEFVRANIIASACADPERVSVVTNVVDTEVFSPQASAPESALGGAHPPASNSSASRPRNDILFIGRLAEEKGLETLIRALPAMLGAVPEASLSIIGPKSGGTERGAYEKRCRALVEAQGLGSRVRFVGPVPNRELPAWIRASRLLAVPSIWGEPCGVVVLEALACGVPVVASRVGGIPELLTEAGSGVLCEARDVGAWSRALAETWSDAALRESCRVVGPRLVQKRHVAERACKRLVEIYEQLQDARVEVG